MGQGAASDTSDDGSQVKETENDVEASDRMSILSASTDSLTSDGVQSIRPASSHDVDHKEVGRQLAVITTGSTNVTNDPRFEVDFDDGENPQDWPMVKKALVIFFMSYSSLVVVMYSTSYTVGIPGMMETFNIQSKTVLVLGVTTYLAGLALGSIVLAPLSEMYGRRPVYLIAVAAFTVLIIPCALAQDLATVLALRFFGAIAGAAMISNSPGTVADISTDKYRALAFSIWSVGPMNGPVVGPLISGFVFQYLGWRWTNWVVMIGSGTSWFMVFRKLLPSFASNNYAHGGVVIPETYAPAILRAKAAGKRKDTADERWHSRYDDKQNFWPILKIYLTRPITMAVKEPICIFWNVYVALVYGVLYLCFVSYPIVFSELRGWSPGLTGLGYIGIGVGGLICISAEPLLRRMINSHAPDPKTGKPPPEAMVSVVCIAAFLVPIGELIFAWTCTPNVHWIAPIIAGIPFGAGNCGVFIYATNYLVGSYGIYAASALAGNAVLRSAVGGTLPLAGPKMYETLGPHWTGTMLALLEFAMIPIPLVFWRYGHKIRQKSTLIRRMREDKERLESKKQQIAEKQARRSETGAKLANGSVESKA